MIGVTLMMLVLLYLFFRHTRIGLAMRAAAANPESARLAGIRVGWMTALGWGMAAAIGSVAGMLIAPVVFLEPNMMLGILLYGFAGAVVGGLTSPGGAVFGGFSVGVIENLAGTYVRVVGSEMKLTIALIIIVAVLCVKPSGLFGRPVVTEGLTMLTSHRDARTAESQVIAGNSDADLAADHARCRTGGSRRDPVHGRRTSTSSRSRSRSFTPSRSSASTCSPASTGNSRSATARSTRSAPTRRRS